MISYKYPSKNPFYKLEKTMNELKFDKKTIQSYLYYITDIINFANKGPKLIKSGDIISYLESLVDKKKSRSTLNTAHSALKFYFETILHRKFFAPHGKIGRAQPKKQVPVILTQKELNKLLKSTKNKKHQLIFEFIHLTGLRISEITDIKVKDLDFFKKKVKIIKKRTSKDKWARRKVAIPENLLEKLKNYTEKQKKTSYLFKNQKGSKLTLRAIQKAFSQVLKKTKINKQATCHCLRHSFAINLAKKGTKTREIQKILGHKLPETAQKYINLAKKDDKKGWDIKKSIKSLIKK